MRLIPALFATAALVAASPGWALHLVARHPQVARSHDALGDWRLDVARNGFTGEVACRLRARGGHAVFMEGAVGFRFPSDWDVSQAVYRVDGGTPRFSRDDQPRLIALGVPLDRGDMTNASGGIVWILYAQLGEANSVTIEPRPNRAPRSFHFRGLQGLYAIAVARGCSPDSRFVER